MTTKPELVPPATREGDQRGRPLTLTFYPKSVELEPDGNSASSQRGDPMKRPEFVMKFWKVVTMVQEDNPVVVADYWKSVIRHGKREGLVVTENDQISENKVLSRLFEVSRMLDVGESPKVVQIMMCVEYAWEYYQEKQTPPPAVHEQ